MENQTPTPPPLTPPPPVFVKKTPKEMIQLFFSGIAVKLHLKKPESASEPDSKVPVKKIIMIGAVIFIILMALVAGVNLYLRMRIKPPELVPSPTPEATAPPVTPPPTRYATDSGVLQIESNLNQLDKELGETDIDEVNLKPRTLLWNINFNQ